MMIERKIRMKKKNVMKEIPENLVSDYSFMGWSKVENKKISSKDINFDRKSFDRD